MPYLVWGGISLAIGIISYFIPADNLNVATDGLYSSIIGVFQNFTNEFKDKYNNIAKTIAPAMVSIGTILIFAYSVKKYKNNEFFEIKTFTQFAFFLALLSLMHFALNSPKKFHSYVEFFVEAPAVILNNAIEETTKTFYTKAQQQSNQSQNKTNQSFLSFASNVGSAVSGGVKGTSVGTGNFLVKTEGAIGNAVNNIKNRASQPENIRTSVGFVNVGSKATR
ncbi:hypothetical protein [Helicobacter pylori]|uniref:hypothetical protein n=1 Tax=Helicobacter pylori TaxID=210 RepID=UPI001125C37B|nr:hypothetical protein [Helicobacter pylori]TPH32073.1 hypothetical protein FIM85_03350 [Helicobacter pylori]